jgi:hypothetical protein
MCRSNEPKYSAVSDGADADACPGRFTVAAAGAELSPGEASAGCGPRVRPLRTNPPVVCVQRGRPLVVLIAYLVPQHLITTRMAVGWRTNNDAEQRPSQTSSATHTTKSSLPMKSVEPSAESTWSDCTCAPV